MVSQFSKELNDTLIIDFKGKLIKCIIYRPLEWICHGHSLDTIKITTIHHFGQMEVIFQALPHIGYKRFMGHQTGS